MEIYEIEKKVSSWNDSPNNYQIAQDPNSGAGFTELTVTITLAEYRQLVAKVATSGTDLEKMSKRAEEAETKLRQQIEETQALRNALKAASIAAAEGET